VPFSEVTLQAIYYYFESKNDILLAIINSVSEKFYQTIVEALSGDYPPHEKFVRAARAHARVTSENGTFIAVWHEERKQLPREVAAKLQKNYLDYHKLMGKLYNKGVENGYFRDIDPKIAVSTILGACQWSYSWYEKDMSMEPEDVANEVIKLISKGFLLA